MCPVYRNIKFVAPELGLPDKTKKKIGAQLQASILTNIRDQRQADGKPIKQNKPATIDQKIRRGRTWRGSVLSLVDEKHRFTRPPLWPFRWDKSKITIEPSMAHDTAEIVGHVQRLGYVGWFAPRVEAIDAVKQEVRDWIRAIVRKATKRIRQK